MKRLFIVKNAATKSPVKQCDVAHSLAYHITNESDDDSPIPFDNKTEAKGLRDYLNNNSFGVRYVVSRGPDHIGPHGNKIRRMRLQP